MFWNLKYRCPLFTSRNQSFEVFFDQPKMFTTEDRLSINSISMVNIVTKIVIFNRKRIVQCGSKQQLQRLQGQY